MIVVCERCKTRFKLGKKRIPPEGMRVRCSRCRHRFHFKPGPPAQSKHSVVERVVENTAPVSSEEEPDLENPEFLHDQRAPSKPKGGPKSASAPAREQPAPVEEEPVLGLEGEAESASEEPMLGAEDEGSAPAARIEVVSSAGAEPEPVDAPAEQDTTDPGPAVGRGVDLGTDLEAFRLEGPVEETAPGQRISEFGPPADDAPPFSFEMAPTDGEALQDPDAEVGASKPARRSTLPRFDLRLPIGLGIGAALKVVTLAVGLLLAGGALRAAVVFGTGSMLKPTAIRAAGWTATRLETFHARDLSGNRILVVRGHLEKWRTHPTAKGREARPRVAGLLLDREGSPIGEEVRARPARLSDAALAPAALSALLDGTGGAVASVRTGKNEPHPDGGDPEGFTILFESPDPLASRIRIQLRVPGAQVGSGS
jgi:predicted Zn finger-like uncharacterized protein